MTGRDVQILPSSPRDAIHLLDAHHALMQSLFPAEANNYLELDELLLPDIRFFGASCQGELVGCGALAVKQYPKACSWKNGSTDASFTGSAGRD